MAHITCPKCKSAFDSSDSANRATPLAAAAALGTAGAAVGAGVGLATGGTAMAVTVPFAIGGGLLGFFGAKSFRRCPTCGHVFRV
jgi:hypothetical protein